MDNDISCIIWTGEKATFGYKDYEEMSMWVIQVLLGQVNCIFLTASPQYGHTHSQIKSFLWGKVCNLGEVKERRGAHTERKKTKAFIF